MRQRRTRRHVVRVGVDLHRLELGGVAPGERIELEDRIHFIAEEGDPPRAVLVMRREDVDRVAADAETAACKRLVVAAELQRDEAREQLLPRDSLAAFETERHARIGLHRADAVNAGHRGDDDDVVAFEDRPRRRVAHAVDLFVYGRILLDIGVGARDIGFRLVVVVIRDEILHRVLGEEVLHLRVQLGRERLVRRQDQGRALHLVDHLRHGEGLARAGDAEQHLVALRRGRSAFAAEALDQLDDRLRLVAGGLVVGHQLETPPALALFRAFGPVRHEGGHLRAGHAGEARRRFSKAAYGAEPGTIVVGHGANIGGVRRLCIRPRVPKSKGP